MGFIKSVLSGHANQFHANQATLATSSFGQSIQQAQAEQQALQKQQQALYGVYGQMATGQGPSLAQLQLQQGLQSATSQAAGAAASQRGINPALAQRLAGQNQASLAGQAATGAAQTRMQEQFGALAAQAALGGQMGQQNLGALGANVQGQQGQNQANIQNLGMAQGINAGVAQQNAGLNAGLVGGLLAGASSGIAQGVSGGAAGGGAPTKAHGGYIDFTGGGRVPGSALYAGDTEKNDTVEARLSPEEIVVPKSHSHDPALAAEFAARVAAVIQKRKMARGGEAGSYADGGVPGPYDPHPGQEVSQPWDTPVFGQGQIAPADPVAQPAAGGLSFGEALAGMGTGLTQGETPPVQAANTVVRGTGQSPFSPFSPAAPAAAAPAQEAQLQPPVRTGGYTNDPMQRLPSLLEQSYGQGQQGITEAAAAKTAQGQRDVETYDRLAQEQQIFTNTFNKQRADLDTEHKALYDRVRDARINPTQFWDSRETWQKVLAGVAIAIGGAGSGLTGGPNQGLAVIQKSIDRDIDAQTINIQKNQNLLAHNMQRYQNLFAAQAATRAQLLAVAGAQASRSAALAQGPEAQANAKILKSQLTQQYVQTNAQLAVMLAKNQLATGGGSVNPEMLPEEARGRLVTLPSGQQRLAYTPKDAADVRDAQQAASDLQNVIYKLKDYRNQHPGGTILPAGASAATRQGAAIHGRAVSALKNLEKAGAIGDADEYIKRLPRPDAFLSTDNSAKVAYDELLDEVNSRVNSHTTSRLEGFRPNPGVVNPGHATR